MRSIILLPNGSNMSIGLLITIIVQLSRAELGRCWSLRLDTQCHGELKIANLATKAECCEVSGYFTSITLSPRESSHLLVLDLLRSHELLNCEDPCQGCSTLQCRRDDQVCVEGEDGRASCVCEVKCTSHQRNTGTVCGDDGHTYNNACHLAQQNCIHGKQTKIYYHGRCKAYSCEGVQCYNRGHYCQTDQLNKPLCVPLPRCGRYQSPVCGTDDKTYSSLCSMVRSNIVRQHQSERVLLQYPGACRANSSCNSDPRCIRCLSSAVFGNPVCQRSQCQETCPDVQTAVCGSDGQTYINECFLRKLSCEENVHTTVLHIGRCEDSESVIEFDLRQYGGQNNRLLAQHNDIHQTDAQSRHAL